jgi:hypothetical protein
VFTERVEGIPSYLRHASRLAEIVRVVGYVAGGLPGSRLLARLPILNSDDTVLRRVKFLSGRQIQTQKCGLTGRTRQDWIVTSSQ